MDNQFKHVLEAETDEEFLRRLIGKTTFGGEQWTNNSAILRRLLEIMLRQFEEKSEGKQ